MRIRMTYRRNEPDTVVNESITITTTYSGTKEEMDSLEEECREKIGSGLYVEGEEDGRDSD